MTMSTPYPGTVSAVQVGVYFVGQYYHVLQQQPDCVHQYYTEASTSLRVDGNTNETATGMLQIHSLVMSLNFTGIEIKSLHTLDSWNGGLLVMVSGYVQIKDFNGRRKFFQTFFLAPQEKGYFVLNDIFHFVDDEQTHQHPTPVLGHGDFESKVNASDPLPEPVSDYTVEEEASELVAAVQVEENGTIDKYSISEQSQQAPEVDNIVEETPAEESIASFAIERSASKDLPPAPVEESITEPQKQTYASILRIAKGQPRTSVMPQASLDRTETPVTSDWVHASQPIIPQPHPAPSTFPERSAAEAADEIATLEEGEGGSVYVRNLPSPISASEIEQEFKNFGRIKADGIFIRSLVDAGVCYAFVEFEDALGVQNSIQASPIQFCGRKVYIEERRANNTSSRGGRRGRGRGGYQSESSRGRFGTRSFGREVRQEGSDRDYSNRLRGNDYNQQQSLQQGRGILANQASRNGSNSSRPSAS